jgi:hypothetical protein
VKKKLELKSKAEKSEESGIAIDADSVTQPQVIEDSEEREWRFLRNKRFGVSGVWKLRRDADGET